MEENPLAVIVPCCSSCRYYTVTGNPTNCGITRHEFPEQTFRVLSYYRCKQYERMGSNSAKSYIEIMKIFEKTG
jgi:hypothetical protein